MKTKIINASMINDILTTIPANGRFFRVEDTDGNVKPIRASKDLVSLDFPVKSITFASTQFVVA